MSTSEAPTAQDRLAAVSAELERAVDEVLAGDGPVELDDTSLQRVVTAAARLHARFGDTHGHTDPLREDVSPTEAVDLACGLLRARDLNPFDLALWFSRPA